MLATATDSCTCHPTVFLRWGPAMPKVAADPTPT